MYVNKMYNIANTSSNIISCKNLKTLSGLTVIKIRYLLIIMNNYSRITSILGMLCVY